MMIRNHCVQGLERLKGGVIVLKPQNNMPEPKLLIFAPHHLLYGRINQSAVLTPLH